MILREAQNAADQVEMILDNNLTSSDLAAPPDPARMKQIDTIIHNEIIRSHIARIVIHNREGQIVYSDDLEMVGEAEAINEKLLKALDGQVVSDISPPHGRTLSQSRTI